MEEHARSHRETNQCMVGMFALGEVMMMMMTGFNGVHAVNPTSPSFSPHKRTASAGPMQLSKGGKCRNPMHPNLCFSLRSCNGCRSHDIIDCCGYAVLFWTPKRKTRRCTPTSVPPWKAKLGLPELSVNSIGGSGTFVWLYRSVPWK